MNLKSFLIVGALTLCSIGIASAKSYSISLSNPTKAGSVELKPGAYEVKISGTQATFTNEGGKSFTVPVTIGQNDKKFDGTSVQAKHADSGDSLEEIDLGGSNTKVQFGQ